LLIWRTGNQYRGFESLPLRQRVWNYTAEGLDGERKTITALFADIRGSTEDLDPEKARTIIDPALTLIMSTSTTVTSYAGGCGCGRVPKQT
jgi:class 3 adenylate cyclase